MQIANRQTLVNLPLLLALLCVGILHLPAAAGQRFSFANTPGRLPKSVVPHAYRVHLQPSVTQLSVQGNEVIEIEVLTPTDRIILNSAGLQIKTANLKDSAGKAAALEIEASDSTQLLTLTGPERVLPGKYELELSWSGTLGEQPQGLFLSRYPTANGEKFLLATQMEPADARRMFPCWDEPVFRASYELWVTAPKAHMVISNMPSLQARELGDGLREVHFAPTPSMSSYLVALAAGEFEALEDDFAGVKLRVLTTEGKKQQGRYALDATKKILTFYNEYFGQPYPLPKLDQFCFPGFPAGGMENWGAIFYNDTTLLVDGEQASQANRERVFGVVAHELAHQWFGNLVTTAWWDDLWLNEGFASWMGTTATARFNPEWNVWERAAGAKEWAMGRDARATTHPIQQPVASESEANDAFDEITYQKGQSFLRMLETYLGAENFRAGIRRYMAEHAYGSTTTADLWAALAGDTTAPVARLAADWTEQPGFPLVAVKSKCTEEKLEWELSQQRFTIHQAKAKPETWKIPMKIESLGEFPKAEPVLLGESPVTVALGPCGTLASANPGGIGYYRVLYDEESLKKLINSITTLPEADRLTLLADRWALLQAHLAEASQLLDLISRLAPEEKSYAVWSEMLEVVGAMDRLLLDHPLRMSYRRWAIKTLKPIALHLGWEPKPGEADLMRSLRASVLSELGEFGDTSTLEEARSRLPGLLLDHSSVAADLQRTVLSLAGRNADAGTYAKLRDLARTEPSAEFRRKLHGALASNLNPDLASETLKISLGSELPPNEAVSLVGRVARDGEHRNLAWSFAKEHREELRAKLSSMNANDFFPGVARTFATEERALELEEFARRHLPAGAGKAVAKSLDDIRFQAEFRTRLLPALALWLDAEGLK